MKRKCSVRGCRRFQKTKGFCAAHYMRHHHGRPLEGPILKRAHGSIAKRLHAHLRIDKATGCHLWMGHRDNAGYGRMWIGSGKQAAHRIAWEVAHGPAPQGMIVMHTICDNPPCCNPAHLTLGTQADNARDRVKKGRGWGARAHDLELHPQWANRPPRRRLARHPTCHQACDHESAPAQPPPRDLQRGESAPSGLPWGESGQVAPRLLEVSIAPKQPLASVR
jgi:hypothetical protein